MKFFRFLFSIVFLKNILLSITIIALVVISVFVGLNMYTNHGESVSVPDLKGLSEVQLSKLLNSSELRYEIIDSIYTDSVPEGTLWEQIPSAGSKVKKHRKLFVIMNAWTKRMVAMPDLKDLSLRQAKTVLESVSLKVGDTLFIPSDFKNLVVGQHHNGVEVVPGSPIPEGSVIDVLVANGLSSKSAILPDLKAMRFMNAVQTIEGLGLNVGATIIDDTSLADHSKDSLFIYSQKPAAETSVSVGASVTVWLTQDTLKLVPDSTTVDKIL